MLAVPVIPVAALVAMEVLWVGIVSVLVSKPNLEDAQWLGGGAILVAVCAAGVKFAFNLRMPYWILFILVAAAILGGLLVIQAGVFLG